MRKLLIVVVLFPFIMLAIGAMTLFTTGDLTYYCSVAGDIVHQLGE